MWLYYIHYVLFISDDEREGRFATKHTFQSRRQGARNPGHGAEQSGYRPPANPDAVKSSQERREKSGRGDGRPHSKSPGMNDPYGIDIAPLNIFENQVIPIMATIRVLSLGTKFIPKWGRQY